MEGDSLDQALRQKWGNQYDAMVASGRRAAKTFAPPEALDRLEQNRSSAWSKLWGKSP